jgi:hypothetical protein
MSAPSLTTAAPVTRRRALVASATAVTAEGGIDAWFKHQLAPDDIPDLKAEPTSGGPR